MIENARILEIIRQTFPQEVEDYHQTDSRDIMEASFVEDLNIDSLDIIELIMKFEDEFNIEISDDAEKIATINDVKKYLENNVNSGFFHTSMDHETKQVIVIRKDLKMRKGKIGAQCAHASMKVFLIK